jgi:hypothetical protein
MQYEEAEEVREVRVVVTRLGRALLHRSHACASFGTSSRTGGRRTSAPFVCLFIRLSSAIFKLLIAVLESLHGICNQTTDGFAGALLRRAALPRTAIAAE